MFTGEHGMATGKWPQLQGTKIIRLSRCSFLKLPWMQAFPSKLQPAPKCRDHLEHLLPGHASRTSTTLILRGGLQKDITQSFLEMQVLPLSNSNLPFNKTFKWFLDSKAGQYDSRLHVWVCDTMQGPVRDRDSLCPISKDCILYFVWRLDMSPGDWRHSPKTITAATGNIKYLLYARQCDKPLTDSLKSHNICKMGIMILLPRCL